MERRRHARTPVNINALLIGEKTVPKGCRIINVSQQGMLLYCEADGRLSTFNDGDTVDIHLTVQHSGEQKKLTIPAIVRHVAENSVDVEFLHPDPILTDMIESYRVSDRHRLEATFGQNHTSGVTPLLAREERAQQPAPPKTDTETPQTTAHRPWYLGMLSLLLGLCIVTGGYIYTASIDSRIRTLETLSEHQASELAGLQDRMFSSSLQEGRYASLNARIAALTDSFATLEHRLLDGTAADFSDPPVVITGQEIPAADSSGAAATGLPGNTGNATAQAGVPAQEAPEATTNAAIRNAPSGPFRSARQAPTPVSVSMTEPRQPEQAVPPGIDTTGGVGTSSPSPVRATVTTGTVSTNTRPFERTAAVAPDTTSAPVAAPGDSVTTARQLPSTGPWRINLLSSPDRGDVTRLADRATSLNIATHIEQAEIKGRTWWRLQVTGFSSMAQASSAAEPLKQSLGITDVWILKHR